MEPGKHTFDIVNNSDIGREYVQPSTFPRSQNEETEVLGNISDQEFYARTFGATEYGVPFQELPTEIPNINIARKKPNSNEMEPYNEIECANLLKFSQCIKEAPHKPLFVLLDSPTGSGKTLEMLHIIITAGFIGEEPRPIQEPQPTALFITLNKILCMQAFDEFVDRLKTQHKDSISQYKTIRTVSAVFFETEGNDDNSDSIKDPMFYFMHFDPRQQQLKEKRIFSSVKNFNKFLKTQELDIVILEYNELPFFFLGDMFPAFNRSAKYSCICYDEIDVYYKISTESVIVWGSATLDTNIIVADEYLYGSENLHVTRYRDEKDSMFNINRNQRINIEELRHPDKEKQINKNNGAVNFTIPVENFNGDILPGATKRIIGTITRTERFINTQSRPILLERELVEAPYLAQTSSYKVFKRQMNLRLYMDCNNNAEDNIDYVGKKCETPMSRLKYFIETVSGNAAGSDDTIKKMQYFLPWTYNDDKCGCEKAKGHSFLQGNEENDELPKCSEKNAPETPHSHNRIMLLTHGAQMDNNDSNDSNDKSQKEKIFTKDYKRRFLSNMCTYFTNKSTNTSSSPLTDASIDKFLSIVSEDICESAHTHLNKTDSNEAEEDNYSDLIIQGSTKSIGRGLDVPRVRILFVEVMAYDVQDAVMPYDTFKEVVGRTARPSREAYNSLPGELLTVLEDREDGAIVLRDTTGTNGIVVIQIINGDPCLTNHDAFLQYFDYGQKYTKVNPDSPFIWDRENTEFYDFAKKIIQENIQKIRALYNEYITRFNDEFNTYADKVIPIHINTDSLHYREMENWYKEYRGVFSHLEFNVDEYPPISDWLADHDIPLHGKVFASDFCYILKHIIEKPDNNQNIPTTEYIEQVILELGKIAKPKSSSSQRSFKNTEDFLKTDNNNVLDYDIETYSAILKFLGLWDLTKLSSMLQAEQYTTANKPVSFKFLAFPYGPPESPNIYLKQFVMEALCSVFLLILKPKVYCLGSAIDVDWVMLTKANPELYYVLSNLVLMVFGDVFSDFLVSGVIPDIFYRNKLYELATIIVSRWVYSGLVLCGFDKHKIEDFAALAFQSENVHISPYNLSNINGDRELIVELEESCGRVPDKFKSDELDRFIAMESSISNELQQVFEQNVSHRLYDEEFIYGYGRLAVNEISMPRVQVPMEIFEHTNTETSGIFLAEVPSFEEIGMFIPSFRLKDPNFYGPETEPVVGVLCGDDHLEVDDIGRIMFEKPATSVLRTYKYLDSPNPNGAEFDINSTLLTTHERQMRENVTDMYPADITDNVYDFMFDFFDIAVPLSPKTYLLDNETTLYHGEDVADFKDRTLLLDISNPAASIAPHKEMFGISDLCVNDLNILIGIALKEKLFDNNSNPSSSVDEKESPGDNKDIEDRIQQIVTSNTTFKQINNQELTNKEEGIVDKWVQNYSLSGLFDYIIGLKVKTQTSPVGCVIVLEKYEQLLEKEHIQDCHARADAPKCIYGHFNEDDDGIVVQMCTIIPYLPDGPLKMSSEESELLEELKKIRWVWHTNTGDFIRDSDNVTSIKPEEWSPSKHQIIVIAWINGDAFNIAHEKHGCTCLWELLDRMLWILTTNTINSQKYDVYHGKTYMELIYIYFIKTLQLRHYPADISRRNWEKFGIYIIIANLFTMCIDQTQNVSIKTEIASALYGGIGPKKVSQIYEHEITPKVLVVPLHLNMYSKFEEVFITEFAVQSDKYIARDAARKMFVNKVCPAFKSYENLLETVKYVLHTGALYNMNIHNYAIELGSCTKSLVTRNDISIEEGLLDTLFSKQTEIEAQLLKLKSYSSSLDEEEQPDDGSGIDTGDIDFELLFVICVMLCMFDRDNLESPVSLNSGKYYMTFGVCIQQIEDLFDEQVKLESLENPKEGQVTKEMLLLLDEYDELLNTMLFLCENNSNKSTYVVTGMTELFLKQMVPATTQEEEEIIQYEPKYKYEELNTNINDENINTVIKLLNCDTKKGENSAEYNNEYTDKLYSGELDFDTFGKFGKKNEI